MAKKIKILKRQSKVMILIEAMFIIFFIIFTFAEIGLTMSMNSLYSANQNYYFLYVVKKLMLSSSFFANYYAEPDLKKSCQNGYEQKTYLSIKTVKNINTTDWTSLVQERNVKTKKIYNNTFRGFTYYNIDVNQPGNDSVDFMYKYQFNNFGGYYFCTMSFLMDQSRKAINVISVNRKCNLVFPNLKTADCGIYNNNAYRMCLILDYLILDNGTSALKAYPNNPDTFWCPINMLKISVNPNPQYDPNNATSKIFNLDIKDTLQNSGNDPKGIDKSFFFNFSPIPIIGSPYNLSTPTSNFIYSDEEMAFTYDLSQPYGFSSPFSSPIYSSSLSDYYYLNFLTPKQDFSFVSDNSAATIPTPFTGADESKFYFLTDSALPEKQTNITFLTDIFPIISQQCFMNIFEANNILSVTAFFYNLGTNFFTETSSVISAWFLAKLFMALWYYGKIRLYTLYEKYHIKLSAPDEKFEPTTFYTAKALSTGIILILLITLHFNGSSFSNIILWTNQVISEKCFNQEIIVYITYYLDFINKLNDKNYLIKVFVWSSVVMELGQVVIYLVYNFTDNQPLTVENNDYDSKLD
jgi:hypothetical protein